MSAFQAGGWVIQGEGDYLVIRDISGSSDNRYALSASSEHKDFNNNHAPPPADSLLPTYTHPIHSFENGWDIREVDDVLHFRYKGENKFSFHPGVYQDFGSHAGIPNAEGGHLFVGVRWAILIEGGILVIRDRVAQKRNVDSRCAFYPQNGQIDL